MAKVEFKEETTVKVLLELSLEEAIFLKSLIENTEGGEIDRLYADKIYFAMTQVPCINGELVRETIYLNNDCINEIKELAEGY
jgi:hypothetical protein